MTSEIEESIDVLRSNENRVFTIHTKINKLMKMKLFRRVVDD